MNSSSRGKITSLTQPPAYKSGPLSQNPLQTFEFLHTFLYTISSKHIVKIFLFFADRPHHLLVSFSVYTNSIYIFRDTSGIPDFKAINGIRAIYSQIILIVHAGVWVWLGPVENAKYSTEMVSQFNSLWSKSSILSAFAHVDEFQGIVTPPPFRCRHNI